MDNLISILEEEGEEEFKESVVRYLKEKSIERIEEMKKREISLREDTEPTPDPEDVFEIMKREFKIFGYEVDDYEIEDETIHFTLLHGHEEIDDEYEIDLDDLDTMTPRDTARNYVIDFLISEFDLEDEWDDLEDDMEDEDFIVAEGYEEDLEKGVSDIMSKNKFYDDEEELVSYLKKVYNKSDKQIEKDVKNLLSEESIDEARLKKVNRVRGGKVQRRKKVSGKKGYTYKGGKLQRMSTKERKRRSLGAKKAARKRRSKKTSIRRSTKKSLRLRKRKGLR